MNDLAQKECVPCKRGHFAPLKGVKLGELAGQLAPDWRVVDEHHLEREYKFKNFLERRSTSPTAWASLAEKVNHHPDFYLAWGKVKLTLWTHKIDGLTESDFVFAAKVDKL